MSNVKKRCPRCQADFFCHQDETCWCVELYLTDTVKDEMRSKYSDCLCEKCLLELGAEAIQKDEE